METLIISLLFLMGLVIIIKGGDWFVESAVWFAKITGIPSVLIGATVVSVATTLPELLVSSIATYQQYYDVAIGNVVGSMVCNIGLILGLSAILSPIQIKRTLFSIKSSFMLICSILLLILARDRMITPKEGNIFIFMFIVYILINIVEFKHKDKDQLKEYSGSKLYEGNIMYHVFKFIIGAVFITLGARLLVNNGVAIANKIGIPEQVVSLTLIALGTSLPELITAISAIIKGHQGISVGNIVGANILNIVMVLGISSKISEPGIVISYQNVMIGLRIYNIPQSLYLDIPVALLLTVMITVGGFLLGKISRALGFLVFTIYCGYLTILAKLFL